MKKCLITIVFVLSICILFYKAGIVYAENTIDSGTCGDNSIWTLTETDEELVLTISGSGPMKDFKDYNTP